MTFRNYTYAPVLISIITLFIAIFILFSQQHSIAFVDSKKVFDSFHLTIELKHEAEQQLKLYTKELDSLQTQLNKEENDVLRTRILEVISFKKQQADNFSHDFSIAKSEIIWKRIRVYANEFAKANNYKLILGAQQNSNIICGDQEIDITADFVKYLNQRYEDNN